MSLPKPLVLLVEDNPGDVRYIIELQKETSRRPFNLEVAENLTKAHDRLQKGGIDVILLDLGLPESAGLSTLQSMRTIHANVPTIVLTGLDDESLGLQAVQDGAQDYLVKGQIDANLLTSSIAYAIEREKTIRQLYESENRYRTLFQQSPDGIIVVCPETHLPLEFNDLACSQLGYSREEFSVLPIFESQIDESRNALKDFFSQPETTHQGDFETRLRTKSGEIRECRVIARTLMWNGERAFQCVVSDITEQKKSFQERQKFEARLQQLQKFESLEKLAGGIAHDLNNILTGIMGYADLAMLRLPNDSAARDNIQRIISAARNAANLGKQMLAFSGKGRFFGQSIRLFDLIQQTSHLIRAAVSRDCEVRFELDEELPAIDGDFSQVSQAVLNLVTNCSEAIGTGPGTITIRSGLMSCDRVFLDEGHTTLNLPEGKYVFLEVADTGPGMPAEVGERIFDPFFSTKFAGRGLGLSTVLGIMRGHRGTIKVASKLGEGTSISLFFPVSTAVKAGFANARTDLTIPGKEGLEGKILIIEDEEGVRLSVKKILEEHGFSVLTASDGFQGLEIFKNAPNDIRLILLDLTMPKMDGEETFRELRKIRGDVRVVLTSGYSEKEATQYFNQGDLAGFLPKPFTIAELLSFTPMVRPKV
ncbi:MAG: response regulator [Candidatus Riflebacteria bacterium]|nr:response regulator [Candidatus Riflebacteria bacterium]